MLSLKVGGQWLSTIGSYGNVVVEFGLHGSEAAEWEMSPNTTHPIIRGNKPVQIFDGGICIWSGTLVEPGNDGQYSARGLWRQAESTPALNSSGDYTTFPNDAIAQAAVRGDITWTGTVAGVDAAWATANGELTLAQLLDGYCAEQALRWVVGPTGVVRTLVDPTTPSWHVPHVASGRGMSPAEDEFVTHLVGRYLVGSGTFDAETVGSATAASVFGRRTARVDLTPVGIITAARANAILTGMFLLSGARMGWGEGLELSYGQITTPGGVPATLAQVQAGQMVRLNGVVDTSRPNLLTSSIDIVIASSHYVEAEDRISLTPISYAPRTLSDILTIAVEDDE